MQNLIFFYLNDYIAYICIKCINLKLNNNVYVVLILKNYK
jgi:hypothetical protein